MTDLWLQTVSFFLLPFMQSYSLKQKWLIANGHTKNFLIFFHNARFFFFLFLSLSIKCFPSPKDRDFLKLLQILDHGDWTVSFLFYTMKFFYGMWVVEGYLSLCMFIELQNYSLESATLNVKIGLHVVKMNNKKKLRNICDNINDKFISLCRKMTNFKIKLIFCVRYLFQKAWYVVYLLSVHPEK